MSDRATIKNLTNDANSKGSIHPRRCQWTAHWMQTRSRTAPSQVCENNTIHECKEEVRGTRPGQLVIENAEHVKNKLLDTGSGQFGIYESHMTRRGDNEGASEGSKSDKQAVPETQKIVVEKELLMHNPRKRNSLHVEAAHLDSSDVHNLFGSSVASLKKIALPHFTATQPEQLSIPSDSKQMDVLGSQALAICNSSGGMSGLGVGKNRDHLVHKSLALPCMESISIDHNLEEGMVQTPRPQIRPTNFLERTLHHKRSWQGDFVGSTSSSGLHGSKTMEASMKCCTGGPENKDSLANDRFTPMELECDNCGSYSALLAYDRKMIKQIDANSSGSPCSSQKGQALQINGGPLTGEFHFPTNLVGDLGRSNKNESVTGSPGDYNTMLGMTTLEDSNCEFYPLHKMPTCSVHDMEMLRISRTVDSMEEVAGGLPKFLKTTHHLLIMKKANLNSSKGDQMVRESTVCTEFKGNVSRKMLGQLPAFRCCNNQEAILQYVGDGGIPAKSRFPRINDELSAETDISPIDAYQIRYSPEGVMSSQLHKVGMVRPDAENFLTMLFSPNQDTGVNHAISMRPAVNKELPLARPKEIPVDNRELSSSRTESFDADHLLSHLEQPRNSHIGPSLDAAKSSRWVKRLRSGASDSLATKWLKMGDTSSGNNVNKLFSRIVSCSKTSSEPTAGECLIGSQSQPLDKAMFSLKNKKSSSADSVKDHQNLSEYSWIQRWRPNRHWRSQERPIPQVASGPESSKVALEELPRKQFPSIAAMALMRKAVNNFGPCELRRTGAFVVWSTNGC